jgi:5-hydroxyisourate hydrolase
VEIREPVVGELSTHILDTMHGRPAADVKVELLRVGQDGTATLIATTRTNNNGRTNESLVAGERFVAGAYELRFHVGEYFRGADASLADPPFLDVVPVRFRVTESAQRYHVPLLVTPWSYSTYRGS